MNNKHLLTGIIAGLTAGAILGILFAPEKGADIRKKIAKKSGNLTDKYKSKFDDLLDKLGKKYNVSTEQAEELISKGKEKIEDMKKDTRDAKNTVLKNKKKKILNHEPQYFQCRKNFSTCCRLYKYIY